METNTSNGTQQKQPVALCLGCNYPLHSLPANRCPECGHPFDLSNPKTFNAERPLTWWDRQVLKPIGWPTFSVIGLFCAVYFYLAFSPSLYYMLIYLYCGALLAGAIGALLIFRQILRRIPPRSIERINSRRRLYFAWAIPGMTILLVVCQVPLRLTLLLAQPELDRIVAQLNDGTLKPPLKSHPAGPLLISSAPYGRDGQYFFTIEGFGGGGGFAYNPSTQPLYYNTGADGHLWGKWHWWIDD